MKKSKTRFLSSFLVLCAFGACSAYAVPTVRMLGTNNTRAGSNVTVVRSEPNNSQTSNVQRLGTIRKVGTGTVAPVTVNKVATTTAPSTTGTADTSRLSLGKYIHSTGVANGTIKPASSATTSSDDFINLANRVDDLESGILTKQGILSTTDGLALSGNTLSLDADILGLPNQVGDLSDALDDVAGDLANNYYTATEIDDLISGVSGGTTTYNGINGVTVGSGNNIGLSVTPAAGSVYVYTSEGWDELEVEDTWE